MCGEKSGRVRPWRKHKGSPPRVRGKGVRSTCIPALTRITPACAGKSDIFATRSVHPRDHPRVCGEKRARQMADKVLVGSPPRVRGKVVNRGSYEIRDRITPACAGKRAAHLPQWRACRDHPRVCGEKQLVAESPNTNLGSPPRVRGKARLKLWDMLKRGITPACAGKRLKRSHSIGHFSCILCLFHSVLHRASVSDGSRAGPCAPPCLPAQNAVPV